MKRVVPGCTSPGSTSGMSDNIMKGVSYMKVTIATHNGSAVARDHNIRNERVVSKETHIDPNGVYEIWHDEKVRDAYKRIFGGAVQDYNERQERTDRKIKNYYKTVCDDKKKHPVYEMIIGIYGKDENGVQLCPEEQGRAIMKDFVDGWKDRNPNLELIGAYYHADEQGEPHVHIDYVPVAHGYKKGMNTQNGLVKAFGEMGIEKQGKATAQMQWEKRENDHLDMLCRARGLEVGHPKEQDRVHIDTELYKAKAQLNGAIDNYNDLQRINKEMGKENIALNRENKQLKGEHKEQKDLQAEKAGKTILGRPKRNITIPYDEYRALESISREVKDIKKARASLKQESEAFEQERAKVQPTIDAANELMDKARKDRGEAHALIKSEQEHIRSEARRMNNDRLEDAEKFMNKIHYKDGTTALERFESEFEKLEKTRSYGRSR